jgi:transcriptional regulator with XRE-family HTH domain
MANGVWYAGGGQSRRCSARDVSGTEITCAFDLVIAILRRFTDYILSDIIDSMNLIRRLRNHAGVTQQVLATRAGTSQPTIALYEAGTKSPTLATLERLASSLGLDLVVTFTPRLTREDQRSLAYHQAIARMLRRDSVSTIRRAKRTLQRTSRRNLGAKALFDRWGLWLELPTEELISKILDPGVLAREMRQVSPFAGVLLPGERAGILARFRREYGK